MINTAVRDRPPIIVMSAEEPDASSSCCDEIVDVDLCEGGPEIDCLHFKEACAQRAADDTRPKPKFLAKILARVLTDKLMRQISNFFSYLGFGVLFDAHRNYVVLPANCVIKNSQGLPLQIEGKEQTAQSLAEEFKPSFTTISPIQAIDKEIQMQEIRYEILPPVERQSHYTIIYYVRRPNESFPIPILGKLYEWVRPILYGTKQDWEPIQIDVNRDTGEPEAVVYETSNYTGDASTFDILSPRNLHLCTKITKQKKGGWNHVVYQKDGNLRSSEISNPFRGHQLEIAFVSWNGLYDVRELVEKRGYKASDHLSDSSLYELPVVALFFLDIDTYCDNGIDLRASWIESRKKGKSVMQMPSRKSHLVRQNRALIEERMFLVVQGNQK
jgi:hypothetical protein